MFVDFQSIATVAAILLSAIALWRSFRKDRSEADEQKLKDVNLRVTAVAAKVEIVEDRIAAVEGELKHLPDKDATHRLELALKEMQTEMGKLTERMKPIANMADRMQEAILEKVMT